MSLIRTATVTLIHLAILTACSEVQVKTSYGERDGRAEALADVSTGAPLKLYFHAFNGYVPRWQTPGLLSCEPDNPVGSKVFQWLEGADWQEGETYSTEEEHRQEAAWTFASAYNRTVFNSRQKEVIAVCPEATLK